MIIPQDSRRFTNRLFLQRNNRKLASAIYSEDIKNLSSEITNTSMITEGTSSDAEQNGVEDMEIETFEENTDSDIIVDAPIDDKDISISNFDEKYSLNKLKFPECAEAAIKALAELATMEDVKGATKLEIQTVLVNDYIFSKIDQLSKKGIPKVHSEFQLINMLTEFICDSQRPPVIRNAIILSLFPCTSSTFDFLGNLICFSICLPHIEILNAAGTWMQQVGPSTEYSKKLAMHIVDYFCRVSPSSMANFIAIAKRVPYFTANLLTAVAEAHRERDPPDQMLHLVDAWININPDILTASLNYCPALPPGGIPMVPITAITALFRWCIFGPTKQESFYYDQSDEVLCKRFKLYSAIHDKILVAIKSLKDSQGNRNAISAYDFEQIIYYLRERCQSKLPNISKASYDLALERLVEVLRAALSANCIYGNTQKLSDLVKPMEKMYIRV